MSRYGAESLGMNALIRTVNGEIGFGGKKAGGSEELIWLGGGRGRQKRGDSSVGRK